jgi:hypothetical protein
MTYSNLLSLTSVWGSVRLGFWNRFKRGYFAGARLRKW